MRGLSEVEAAERLRTEGDNELSSSRPRSVLAIAVDVVREPMFLLLVGAGAVYLVLGDVPEALILLSFVLFVIGITFYQERKTERALEALRDLSSPRALVVRDGEQRRIPGREVVRGDILVLSEGDRVPADGVVLSCTNLSTDESLLTGESAPVGKAAMGRTDGAAGGGRPHPNPLPKGEGNGPHLDRISGEGTGRRSDAFPEGTGTGGRLQPLLEGEETVAVSPPGGDGLPFVYSGTLVVRGQGVARALATGTRTQMGRIGRALQRVQIEETRLQRDTRDLVRLLALVGLGLCAAILFLFLLTNR